MVNSSLAEVGGGIDDNKWMITAWLAWYEEVWNGKEVLRETLDCHQNISAGHVRNCSFRDSENATMC